VKTATVPPHRTWTVSQLAELLQVSNRTVRRLVQTNGLPRPKRIGRQVRWSDSIVQSILSAK
jgi:excisionase family DNA binding protein